MQGFTMPFLWVSDNRYNAIGKEIEKIKESGSETFCVESRTYEDFCGEGWWQLMDFIIQKAAELGMKVWLLDDKHFPSGSANGAVERNPRLRAKFIKATHTDICGPVHNGKLLLWATGEREGTILSVALLRRRGKEKYDYVADLTQDVRGDFLYFSTKAGEYRICVLETATGYDVRYPCVDKCNPESVRLMIDEVYAPHYERYQNTCFAGFFSDEPGFFNGDSKGYFNRFSWYGGELGALGFSYPWNDCLSERLAGDVKEFSVGKFAALWNDIGRETAPIRISYMNAITRMYAENYSGQLSDWCHARGLQYASHILEDMGAHARTRESAGHYFRSQKNADYAGIDVVLHQIKPYCNRHRHLAPVADGYVDPKFFNNTLAKLASSCARLCPEKKGALCEIFGAYGWAEGSEEMLWLVNHMLVRGINRFIPHAFSPVFPLADCPPHFYANGKNPMFGAYCDVIGYINRVCILFENGESVISTAVLYHAESEWSGKNFLPCDDVIETLLSHQIDCDIVPQDLLPNGDELTINGHRYTVLCVPYCEYFSNSLRLKLQAIGRGVRVVIVGGTVEGFECVSLNQLPSLFNSDFAIVDANGNRNVRARKVIKGNAVYYFVHNEGRATATVGIRVPPPFVGVKELDFLNEKEERVALKSGIATIAIGGGQARIFELMKDIAAERKRTTASCKTVFKRCELCDVFDGVKEIVPNDWTNILQEETEFSGVVRIFLEPDLRGARGAQIEFSGESLTLKVRDKTYRRIASPAFIEWEGEFEREEVMLEIATTLTEKTKDKFSKFSVLRPIGIRSMRKIYYEE